LGLARAEVRLTPVETLNRQVTGKLKRFVPLGARPHLITGGNTAFRHIGHLMACE
jgi:hypothetical protein